MAGSSRNWDPTPPSSPCGRVNFRALLNSPQPAVIAVLQPGHVLRVKLQTTPSNAVVVEYQGQIAGALTGTQVNTLTNCILNGFEFVATVVELRGGSCIVDVTAA